MSLEKIKKEYLELVKDIKNEKILNFHWKNAKLKGIFLYMKNFFTFFQKMLALKSKCDIIEIR